MLGGIMALRFGSAIYLPLGLSSRAAVGVALFELLPEALPLGHCNRSPADLAGALTIGLQLTFRGPNALLTTTSKGGHLGAVGLTPAVFTGFSLYIGASQLLPKSHERRLRLSTVGGSSQASASLMAPSA